MHMVGGGVYLAALEAPPQSIARGAGVVRTVLSLDSIGDRGVDLAWDVGVGGRGAQWAGGRVCRGRGPHKVGNRPTSAPEDVWMLLR